VSEGGLAVGDEGAGDDLAELDPALVQGAVPGLVGLDVLGGDLSDCATSVPLGRAERKKSG
jgi:hypothetical protein